MRERWGRSEPANEHTEARSTADLLGRKLVWQREMRCEELEEQQTIVRPSEKRATEENERA